MEAGLVYKHFVPNGTVKKRDDQVSTDILSLTGQDRMHFEDEPINC